LKAAKVRHNPTYNSRIFPFRNDQGIRDQAGECETQILKSVMSQNGSRQCLDGPLIEKPRRKKLGNPDSKVEEMFGSATCDFAKSNTMNVIT